MTLEDRLQSHLDEAARRLPTPGDRLDDVVAGGRRRRRVERAAVALALVALAVAVPASLASSGGPDVEFADSEVEPVPRPDVEPEPDPEQQPEAERQPAPSPSESSVTVETPATPALAELGARVLAYDADGDGPVLLVEPEGFARLRGGDAEPRTVHLGVADVALPDGRNGAVVQPAGQSTILWYPDVHSDRSVVLMDGEERGEPHRLRAVDPGGRVIYSVRPPSGEPANEEDRELLYAVELAEGAEQELLGDRSAFEVDYVGPAWSASGPVHASCHLLCTLQPGLVTSEGERLYGNDTAIDGLTATPDGRIVAFVEGGPAGERVPELVLLDGESFAELARVPMLPDADEMGHATVSLSADGQRVLVGLGSVEASPLSPIPVAAYLVEDALGEDPTVTLVEFEGAVRWFDPSAAVAIGGEPTEEDLAVADALLDLAAAPSAEAVAEVPFAGEVAFGIGPDLVRTVSSDDLDAPEAWRVEGPGADGLWRAAVGPFSALELLSEGDGHDVAVGPHPHCAAPPVPAPDAVSGLRRVSIQPEGFDSCLEWWTVDAFLDPDGRIVAITLDLWEP